ncbi:diadenylate cyclase [Gilvibacter sp.]|uniref:diadenylate cyclase n=1 Tax=Gilvibacter sp. TaxID=2729997 RepID=UPI0025C584E0|nr:diadenylate cyclase [Gilvibacter sp.]NQX78460.1 diadenylate cyclase [Gilvibacter sp.]
MNLLDIRVIDIVDIVLVAALLFYLYRLVKGTVAINIFIGIVILYTVWKFTELLEMELFSKILGGFLGAGVFALIVVFQQEIRKFLLMVGSTNFKARKKFFKQFKLNNSGDAVSTNVQDILAACKKMGAQYAGALIVMERNTNLDFVKNTGDRMNAEVNQPIIESIFFKNSPLHDGAMVIEGNTITATRVILPVSNDRNIPLRFGLRHRAAIGITEKTDALCLVVSEENGQISYIKDGEFIAYENFEALGELIRTDLS